MQRDVLRSRHRPNMSLIAPNQIAVSMSRKHAVVEFDALAEVLPTAAGKADAMTKAAAALKAIGDTAGAKEDRDRAGPLDR